MVMYDEKNLYLVATTLILLGCGKEQNVEASSSINTSSAESEVVENIQPKPSNTVILQSLIGKDIRGKDIQEWLSRTKEKPEINKYSVGKKPTLHVLA